MVSMPIRRYDKDFILDRIAMHPDTGCWHWTMQKDAKGYGRVSYGCGEVLVHRLSYRLFVGDIPSTYVILHKCDNPICCNPDHLLAGTYADNRQDAMEKGRIPLNLGGPNRHPKEVVDKMHKLFEKGATIHEVMEAVKVSRSSVKLYRTNWNNRKELK